MKFTLIFDGSNRTIRLTPEGAGEAALLGSLTKTNGDIGLIESAAQLEWSEDRIPYKKVTAVVISL